MGPTIAVPALPAAAAAPTVTDDDVAEAAAAVAALESGDHPPALAVLAERLGLSRFERDVLLLCAATEFDTGLGDELSRVQGAGGGRPTFALAFTLFDDPVWEVLSPERPLRHWRLVEINQRGGDALVTSGLRADERIVNYLKGVNYLDDRLSPLFVPLGVEAPGLPPSQLAVADAIGEQLRSNTGGRSPVVLLLGPQSHSKRLIARQAAAGLGRMLLRLPVESLPSNGPDLETLERLWQRETALAPVALYLDAHDIDENAPEGPVTLLCRLLAKIGGTVFVDSRDVIPGIDRTTLLIDVHAPTQPEQRDAWAEALGDQAGDSPALLAGQFNLDVAAVGEIATAALREASATPLGDRLWDGCLARTRPRLDVLAQRIDPAATWEQLVLPDDSATLLRRLADQVGHRATVYGQWGFGERTARGLGITALFAGESGTGKTMAAEVIAKELRLNLYRIDLSAVVSKYIGETEKNLRRLFDAAEDGGVILFFDEADALFGKRSEVKDSHDRYANIEVNYLLQRMEAYRGLAILATNMKAALDPAFTRRLRFIVTFPFPGPHEREAMWRSAFPPGSPVADLDYPRLAKFNLAGGSIQNIALNAAFLAASQREPVTMPLVLSAAEMELRKLDRPMSAADLRASAPTRMPARTTP
jgi:hypothetical protein